jgi:hypothetical protein
MWRIWAVSVAGTLLSGCVAAAAIPLVTGGGAFLGTKELAKSDMNRADRQAASANAIGQDLNARKIKISDVAKNGDVESWTATTAVGTYRCTMGVGRQTARCVKGA